MINLFRVGDACTITDLPGYGFAKVSKEMQAEYEGKLALLNEQLECDARHSGKEQNHRRSRG